MQLNSYLHFNGRCEEALKFYERCLGGRIDTIHLYEGSPMAQHMPPEWQKKILHARFVVGENLLMGSDVSPDRYQEPKGFSVSLDYDKPEEADRVFHALSENGKVEMPIQKTFWAERFGMFTDQFGIPWMVNCEKSA